MSETEKPVEGEKRIPYVMQITFWEQHGGPVRVFARDVEHAKELLPKLIPSAKDITIHDVVEESALQKIEPDPSTDETPQTPMVH